MDPKFDFYEVVSVLPCDAVPGRLWGTCGVVVGRSGGDGSGWEYAIQAFADESLCWQLEERCLRTEGRKMSRDDLYTGEARGVRVDPATGKGSPRT
ncbi:Imm31 family immunity protein [Sorangium sp. So ce1099]|uniref:Imm31 family immunity protein n=1 Tax=Sorangium sp. So ce1099 TaxID=3133331 RepID=UPI003F63E14F